MLMSRADIWITFSPGTERSRSPKFCAGEVAMASAPMTLMVAGALTSEVSEREAVTTTSSPRMATFSVIAGTWTVPDAGAVTSWLTVPNPLRPALTRYDPAGTAVKVYAPSEPVVWKRFTPAPVSWTLAPGRSAPDSSTTVPDTLAPLLGCACAGTATATRALSARTPPVVRQRLIGRPP